MQDNVEQRIFDLVEASFRNEEAVAAAIESLQKLQADVLTKNEEVIAKAIKDLMALQFDLRRTTENVPARVDKRVDAVLDKVVNDSATKIAAKFTDAEQKAAKLSNHYDMILSDKFGQLYLLVTLSAITSIAVIGGIFLLLRRFVGI